jgi:hypothetical protein
MTKAHQTILNDRIGLFQVLTTEIFNTFKLYFPVQKADAETSSA